MGHELAASAAFQTKQNTLSSNPDILETVEKQDQLEQRVPWAIYAVVIGFPLLTSLLSGKGISFTSVLSALICLFIARGVIWAVKAIVLVPLRDGKFNRAAALLKGRLDTETEVSAGPYSWTLNGPGAMAITRTGEVIVVDRSSGFSPLIICSHEIAAVEVKHHSQIVTDTRHSGRTTIGGMSGSFGLAQTMGGRSSSVTRSIDNYVLEIRYQRERNGMVKTALIPGGSNHLVVEEICAAVRRLECSPATNPISVAGA